MVNAIYDDDFQRRLFDEMQGTYETVCTITSFGFNRRWRRQLLSRMKIDPGMTVCDLMSGAGETWPYILPRIGRCGSLSAVDFSHNMTRAAQTRRAKTPRRNIAIREEDALRSSVPSASADALVCSYGVKTLSPEANLRFVREIKRILKDGGQFGLVEVSLPRLALLRVPYILYLRHFVPVAGRLLLGNPENYRMLSTYVGGFRDCLSLCDAFADEGFDVTYYSFFWGCATALVGQKRCEEEGRHETTRCRGVACLAPTPSSPLFVTPAGSNSLTTERLIW
jgi:demethylmenaquinone methyltransferase/2-methoxy-6-polyprenyl-1,4-benzoquinol methylase